ncbi:MAG TPA: helix-turn-helix transcriptional regulator [Turneriella sp.]|nr:helix-turn-helix transcriptional regulator [Turneriella sp.]
MPTNRQPHTLKENISSVKRQVGKRIRILRKAKNLTQEQVAMGRLSLRAYQRIETGTTNVGVDNLFVIADALDVHISEFFENINLESVDVEENS